MAEDFELTANSSGELSTSLDGLALRTRDLELRAGGFARAMTQAFRSAAVDGKRFDDVLRSLALRLSDLSLKAALKPLERSIGSGLEGLFRGLIGSPGKLDGNGEIFLKGLGDIKPFADGGVIATPGYFPLGRGTGLAGEAGPEAILPLARTSDGRLGVAAESASRATNVTIHIATPDAASFRRSETYVSGLIARAVARGQRGL
jgi:phage-related minor tail protein